jgi:membrane-associated HD superfamily phosphohydrolase
MPEYEPLQHLLNKHNILSDFKITYQVNKDEIESVRNELSKRYKSKKTIDNKINQYIQDKFGEISKLRIPGCIYPTNSNVESPKKIIKNTTPPKVKEENLFIRDFKAFSKEEQKDIVESSKIIIDTLNSKILSNHNLFFIFQLVYNSLKIKSSTFSKISKKYENQSTSLNDNAIDDDMPDEDMPDEDSDLGHLF